MASLCKPLGLVYALALLVAMPTAAQRSALGSWELSGRAGGTGQGVAPGGDRYSPYPDLDLDTIPFHGGTEGWSTYPIEIPDEPVTTRSVNVDTLSEFNTEAQVDGTQITITAAWNGTTGIGQIAADDIRVIINADVAISGPIQIGETGVAHARIRIQGPTAGTYSGGRLGQIRFNGAPSTSIIIDGIGLNGAAAVYGNAAETNACFRAGVGSSPSKLAIVNTRCIAGGYCYLMDATHVVIAGSSCYSGAATHAEVGYPERWSFRNHRGPVVIFESDFRSTLYPQVRTHSEDSAGEYLYIGYSTLVALAEGWTLWAWPNLGNNSGLGDGFLFEHNNVYAHSNSCEVDGNPVGGPQMSTYQCQRSTARNNTFYSAGDTLWDQTYLDSLESGGGSPGPHSWGSDENNTFETWTTADPAWGGAGDPLALPLPAGLSPTPIRGEVDCPGVVW